LLGRCAELLESGYPRIADVPALEAALSRVFAGFERLVSQFVAERCPVGVLVSQSWWR
jgi:hypothetical protein